MGLDLGYKVDVTAIAIKILSKFLLSPLQNALEHCHDGEEVRFNCTDKAKHAAKTWLRNQSAEFFKNGINGWKDRLGKLIDVTEVMLKNKFIVNKNQLKIEKFPIFFECLSFTKKKRKSLLE